MTGRGELGRSCDHGDALGQLLPIAYADSVLVRPAVDEPRIEESVVARGHLHYLSVVPVALDHDRRAGARQAPAQPHLAGVDTRGQIARLVRYNALRGHGGSGAHPGADREDGVCDNGARRRRPASRAAVELVVVTSPPSLGTAGGWRSPRTTV